VVAPDESKLDNPAGVALSETVSTCNPVAGEMARHAEYATRRYVGTAGSLAAAVERKFAPVNFWERSKMTFDDRSRQGALGQHAEDDGSEESGLRDRHGWRTGEGLTRRAFARVTLAIGAAAAGLSEPVFGQGASREQAVGVPKFEVDAAWPRIPNKWIFGPVTSIRVDEQDHVWILQRPRSVRPEEKAHAAPPSNFPGSP
jgi:hypothetical protein